MNAASQFLQSRSHNSKTIQTYCSIKLLFIYFISLSILLSLSFFSLLISYFPPAHAKLKIGVYHPCNANDHPVLSCPPPPCIQSCAILLHTSHNEQQPVKATSQYLLHSSAQNKEIRVHHDTTTGASKGHQSHETEQQTENVKTVILDTLKAKH